MFGRKLQGILCLGRRGTSIRTKHPRGRSVLVVCAETAEVHPGGHLF